ncbi:MAG: TrbG/VirB9 family P-type conjugative transfer protein [Campylobacteraceae bacterium]|jgi:type IV secretion system protein VirB9/ComB9 competence protein|nr:TrbG/VirB9 family P-type conjugative transfer protein [Campylobacteraceae bacterium]
MLKKVIISILIIFSVLRAQESIFLDDSQAGGNINVDGSALYDMIDLNAIQDVFFNKKRTGNENVLNLTFQHGKTYKVRTRYAMTTTIILKDDTIIDAILGDEQGFSKITFKKDKYDLSNIVIIKPKLIGIDTSLTIIGESGKIYPFYLFSTDHNSKYNPHMIVYVGNGDKIDSLNIRNLDKEAFEADIKRRVDEQNGSKEYIIIGDNVNEVKIDTDDIKRGYVQSGADSLRALDIFNDKKWTYFRYDKDRADSRFPVIYRVVDGYDNPVNSRIVGNYIIAETISDKFTLRIGDEYVCVRKNR